MSDQIYITIAKALNGEATDAEKKELREWLNADESHAAEYKEMQQIWSQSDTILQSQPTFNATTAWDRIAAKTIDIPAPSAERKTISFPAWAKLGLAAAAALLIGLFIFRQPAGTEMMTAYAENGNLEVILPDNSHITLRKGSKLEYPKAFASNQRNVELEGEAFFEVTRNEKKPFIIDAQSATVQVLGTSFNVKADENTATVVVATGKVKMSMNSDKAQALILTPGEKGSLRGGALKEELVNINNYLFWKTGILKIEDQPLSEVARDLADINNAEIRLNMPDQLKQAPVTTTFNSQQPLEEMLTELCLITNCRWTKEGNTYTISPKG